jgi:hypothetical protein
MTICVCSVVMLTVGCCFIVAIPIFVSSETLAWCLAYGVLERCLGALGGIYRPDFYLI